MKEKFDLKSGDFCWWVTQKICFLRIKSRRKIQRERTRFRIEAFGWEWDKKKKKANKECDFNWLDGFKRCKTTISGSLPNFVFAFILVTWSFQDHLHLRWVDILSLSSLSQAVHLVPQPFDLGQGFPNYVPRNEIVPRPDFFCSAEN